MGHTGRHNDSCVQDRNRRVAVMTDDKKRFKDVCRLEIHMKIAYCYLCGKPILKEKDFNIDHVVPLSRSGRDDSSNWRMCHISCNSKKGALTFEEYKLWLSLEAKRNGHVK